MFIKKAQATFAKFLIIALAMICFVTSTQVNAQPSTTSLKLPPSLERELRLRRANAPRVIRFSDTVKADKLISASLRDSSARELDSTMVRDSAIFTIDSVVSLSHKEWLDSMLAELPETEHTSEGLRFHYPYAMMLGTSRRQVPFDSSLPMKMDPVSKEDLPLFDALPMEQPMIRSSPQRYYVSLMLGAPYLPDISAKALLVNSSHTSIELGGTFAEGNSNITALREQWNIIAHGFFSIPFSQENSDESIPMVDAEISSSSLTRSVHTKAGSNATALSRNNAEATASFGSLDEIKLTGSASLHYFNDNIGTGLSERSGSFSSLFEHQRTDSSNRIRFSLVYNGASTTTDKLLFNGALGALSTELTLVSPTKQAFHWEAGLTFINAADATASTTYLFPKLKIAHRLSPDLNVFLSLGRSATTQTFDRLYTINPFYAPLQPNRGSSVDSLLLRDDRRVSIDRYSINLGSEYLLSSEDRLQFVVSYYARRNALSFFPSNDSGIVRYYPKAVDARIFSVDLSAGFILLKNDRLNITTHFSSTLATQTDKQLPYEPIFTSDISYLFGSISPKLFPSISCKFISREEKSLFFINLMADYLLDSRWKLQLLVNNLFDTDGAFWETYTEYPRQIGVGINASF